MTPSEAEELYGIHRWGAGYFAVGPDGTLRVHPTAEPGKWVALPQVVAELQKRKAPPPVVLRFPQIIATQVQALHKAFHGSIAEFQYGGRYRGVFPIKVNQAAAFVEELVACGKAWSYGLEAGTKPELALVLSVGLKAGSLIVCNGYKDRSYVELALSGVRMGYQVVLIIEKLHELDLVLEVAEKLGVRPLLGLRLRVHARGTGKWERSGGEASKFGLSTAEILEAVRVCRARGWTDRLKLLHFHIGSQITEIRRIKQGVQEGARFYAALRREGIDIEYLDVGGGLGVDYDGSRTASDSSVNYSLREYTNDVIYTIKDVCEEAEVPVPDIISESGRAVAAYHSLVVFSVERQQTLSREVAIPELREEHERCIWDLVDIRREIGPKNFMEAYHDTLQLVEQMHMLFNLGHVTLEQRAIAESASAEIFRDVVYYAKQHARRLPEEIEELEQRIASKYVCNMSVFQSMPDLFSVGQLFPIAPIHRLDEHPSVWATLQDITCDSDGKIDKFGDVREDQDAIRLHRLLGKPYHLAAFLVGAYQDVMGDYHNMLGETKEARVMVTGPGEAEVSVTKIGTHSSGEVLALFGYSKKSLRKRFESALHGGNGGRAPSPEECAQALRALERVLTGTPYLAQQS